MGFEAAPTSCQAHRAHAYSSQRLSCWVELVVSPAADSASLSDFLHITFSSDGPFAHLRIHMNLGHYTSCCPNARYDQTPRLESELAVVQHIRLAHGHST